MSTTNSTPPCDSDDNSGKRFREKLLPNSTPVPNWVFDKVLRIPGLRGTWLKVFFFIWRKTVGWNRDSDFIPLTQIQNGTGLSRRDASEGSEIWERVGLVTRESVGALKMVRFKLNPKLDPNDLVLRLTELVSKGNRFRTETSSEEKPKLVSEGNSTGFETKPSESNSVESNSIESKAPRQKPPEPPLAFSGLHLQITEKQDKTLADAFPWLAREVEYKKADSWCEGNPEKRPKRNVYRFMHNWFGRIREPQSQKVRQYQEASNGKFDGIAIA